MCFIVGYLNRDAERLRGYQFGDDVENFWHVDGEPIAAYRERFGVFGVVFYVRITSGDVLRNGDVHAGESTACHLQRLCDNHITRVVFHRTGGSLPNGCLAGEECGDGELAIEPWMRGEAFRLCGCVILHAFDNPRCNPQRVAGRNRFRLNLRPNFIGGCRNL